MFKLLCVVLVLVAVATQIKGEVVVLDDESYESFHNENPVSIIKFYAPWCGHCKSLAPTWELYGNDETKEYKVAKVDCTVATATCGKEGVRGYPTVKVFVNGEATPHQGQRTIDAFHQTVQAAVAKQSTEEIKE